MSRFFDPEPAADDKRRFAPAAGRNKDYILAVLQDHLPTAGALLEVASGTGEHAAHFAPHFPDLVWQPSDIDPANLASIKAWQEHAEADNLRAPRRFDVLADDMTALNLPVPLTAVKAVNLIHIAPWIVAEALVEKAGQALSAGATLFLYGPFMRGGQHTAPSNEAFDASLRSRDPSWGVRALEDVADLAKKHSFEPPVIVEMPANNLSVIFRKA